MTKSILVLAANPKNTPPLRLDREIREISNGLQRAQKRDEFILKQVWAVRQVDVRRAMLDNKPNIVHFCGHGSGDEGIAFEDENGEAKLVSAEALTGFFELFSNKVECVVLNACYSEVQAEAIAKHIPSVIGMKRAIGDAAAIEYGVAFYDALGAGETVEFAHKLACNAIQWAGLSENLTPVLKSVGHLVQNAARPAEAVKKTDKNRIQEIKNGYCTSLGPLTIKVSLGRIEESECSHEKCLIALPANEFFDDDCINDSQSALGAFMQHHFKETIPNIQTLVKNALDDEPSERVEKKPREFASSYGVGKCVFLDRPLSSNFRIALVSVTTQRANIGLRADAHYIFQATESIQRLMANNRLKYLHLPLLGSGHGGLKGELSLLCMLIAFGELNRRPTGHQLREVNIVVYKRGDDFAPSISEMNIKQALDFTNRFLKV